MEVVVCAIAKMENHYIREWVEHYKNMGVDKIFLYDNNDIDGECFEEVINDYITNGFVKIIDFRGRVSYSGFNLQSYSYEDFYEKYSEKYDWVIIVDIDEYIIFETPQTIKEFLSNPHFDEYDQIRLNWKNFGDDDIVGVVDNNYNLLNRFHIYQESILGKSIIRTKINGISKYINGHGCNKLKSCNAIGTPLEMFDRTAIVSNPPFYNVAWINHYRTKTLQEFIEIKYKRGYPDSNREVSNDKLDIFKYFFKINKITPEKLDFLKKKNIDITNIELCI